MTGEPQMEISRITESPKAPQKEQAKPADKVGAETALHAIDKPFGRDDLQKLADIKPTDVFDLGQDFDTTPIVNGKLVSPTAQRVGETTNVLRTELTQEQPSNPSAKKEGIITPITPDQYLNMQTQLKAAIVKARAENNTQVLNELMAVNPYGLTMIDGTFGKNNEKTYGAYKKVSDALNRANGPTPNENKEGSMTRVPSEISQKVQSGAEPSVASVQTKLESFGAATNESPTAKREVGDDPSQQVENLGFGDNDKTPIVGGEIISPTAVLPNDPKNEDGSQSGRAAEQRGYLAAISSAFKKEGVDSAEKQTNIQTIIDAAKKVGVPIDQIRTQLESLGIGVKSESK